ncbi:unnamed protein product [Prorocentrum cordatum]|nr:unnamed protein product [Polarella glacialis]
MEALHGLRRTSSCPVLGGWGSTGSLELTQAAGDYGANLGVAPAASSRQHALELWPLTPPGAVEESEERAGFGLFGATGGARVVVQETLDAGVHGVVDGPERGDGGERLILGGVGPHTSVGEAPAQAQAAAASAAPALRR